MLSIHECSEFNTRPTANRSSLSLTAYEEIRDWDLPKGWRADRSSSYTVYVNELAKPYRSIKLFIEYDLTYLVVHNAGSKGKVKETTRRYRTLDQALLAMQTILLFY